MTFTNNWDEAEVSRRLADAGKSELERDLVFRVYTSQLIGRQPDLVMHGGGNTSCKSVTTDLLGNRIDVLCVKGSGWDLGTIEAPGLPAVRLDRLLELESLDGLSDEEMVNVQRANLLDSAAPNPSVETLLHAFLPHKFIDHTHATPFLALANLPDAEAIMGEIFGGEMVYVPYVMPGFDLARTAAACFRDRPESIGMLLGKHGHFTWGPDAKTSYDRVIEQTNRVEEWFAERRRPVVFSGTRLSAGSTGSFLSRLRGELADDDAKHAHMPVFDIINDDQTMGFLEREDLPDLAATGVATPDHVIRIKPFPLVLDLADAEGPREQLAARIAGYANDYKSYFDEQSRKTAQPKTMLSARPKLIWARGVGVIGVGQTGREARVVTDLAQQNIRVMLDGAVAGGFEPIGVEDLFDMEYWSLEQAKLGKADPPALAGRVVVVTGGAGVIGAATAAAFLAKGAEVLLVDRDDDRLASAATELSKFGGGRVEICCIDIIRDDAPAVIAAQAINRFGGIDILVSNAGAAVPGTMYELDEAIVRDSFELNFFAHYRIAKAVNQVFVSQGRGGQLLFNVSKQAVNPGHGFGAYGLPKATLMFLVRQLALELGETGVRVNGVNADRIRSGLLTDEMIASRSSARRLSEKEYMAGNLIGREVRAEHVADAFLTLAFSERTTGHVMTVDGGNIAASLR